MRFLIDACMPRPTGELLSSYGHVSQAVRDIGMGASTDREIARHAQDHQLVVLSSDLDFADVTSFPPADYHGIIVVRPAIGTRDAKLAVMRKLLEEPTTLALVPGRLCIVTETKIRLRPRP